MACLENRFFYSLVRRNRIQTRFKGENLKRLYELTAMLLLIGSPVHAQTPATLSGQWTGTTKSPSTGNELHIQVRLSESAGTWRYVSPAAKAAPCLGREFPMTVKSLLNARTIFNVDGASVITGCPSFSLTLERTDEETLTGSFGDGRPVVLRKQ